MIQIYNINFTRISKFQKPFHKIDINGGFFLNETTSENFYECFFLKKSFDWQV